jgi:hypothetical protein
MIAARMRDDNSEMKSLIGSAQQKNWNIRAGTESDICEAWHQGHEVMIILNAVSRIDELTSALNSAMLIADSENDEDLDHDLVEKLIDTQATFGTWRKATLFAFQDWISEYGYPVDEDLLTGCSAELSILHHSDENKLREHSIYKSSADIFTKISELK